MTQTSPDGKRESFFTPAIQDFCVALFGPEDEHLRAIATGARAAGFPTIAISPMDGQVVRLLVTLVGAKRAVEIGTLGGYSALWIARALGKGGRLDTFELDPERAAFARQKLAAAKLDAEVVVHVGAASQRLGEVNGPFDFVFIDADKLGYPAYLEWAAANLRKGGMVALDNAFAWGRVADPNATGDAAGVRKALEMLSKDTRFSMAAMIPTNEGLAVGIKG